MISFHTKGSVIIEVVVASAIISLVSLAFLGTLSTLAVFHQKDMLSIKGGLLAEEGLEAVRFVKGSGWSNLSSLPLNTPRYFTLATSSWSVTTTPEIIDGLFYRSFKLNQVSRDGNDDIVPSGGTIDSNTFFAEASVSWRVRNATTTITYKTYVTNI
ncbi:MAG: hypothetical protein RLZZ67_238 [Candidatus Parcubacteria bacterium]|jgi:hypothetical protein